MKFGKQLERFSQEPALKHNISYTQLKKAIKFLFANTATLK